MNEQDSAPADRFARTLERALGRPSASTLQRDRFARDIRRGAPASPLAHAAEVALAALVCRYNPKPAPVKGCACPACLAADQLRRELVVDAMKGGA